MNWTMLLQKIRTMQFEQIYRNRRWKNKDLRQAPQFQISPFGLRHAGLVRRKQKRTNRVLYFRTDGVLLT